jgi:hemoglobin
MKLATVILSGLVCAFAGPPALAQSAPPPAHAHPGETEVDPYTVSDANAGAAPIADPAVFAAFNGVAGVGRVVDGMVDRVVKDPRTADIFRETDLVRTRRTLKEQFCFLLGGPCAYTGRDMKSSHADHGITTAEFNALVENLQASMDAEGVPFAMQNRLLARLAPMKRDVVVR